jgi:hypothetical protein
MRHGRWLAGVALAALALAGAPPARAQVELRSALPEPLRGLDIVVPGPTSRELTRPRDLEFYGEDQRVPYNPAFIEPLTTTNPSGTVKAGVSAYTAPHTPVGPLSITSQWIGMGALSLGFTLIWDLPQPEAAQGAPPAR